MITDVTLAEFNMEYQLSLALHMPCCSGYLFARKAVLIPEIIRQSEVQGADPADILARFVNRLHARTNG